MLEQLYSEQDKYDVDVLILYDESVSPVTLVKKVHELVCAGNSVSTQKSTLHDIRYRTIIDLGKEEQTC
jgi:hypothetical protein